MGESEKPRVMTDRDIEEMLRKSGVPECELEASTARIMKATSLFRVALEMIKATERLGFGDEPSEDIEP